MEGDAPRIAALHMEIRTLATAPDRAAPQRTEVANSVLALPSADLLALVRLEAAANPALEVVEQPPRQSARRPRNTSEARASRRARAGAPSPDVTITREAGSAAQRGFEVEVGESAGFTVRLRPEWLLRQIAARDPRATLGEGERQHIEQCVARARLCVALISQRQQMLARLTWCLIHLRWDALQRGDDASCLLDRTAVAFRIGMHEPTFSRAIAGKYVRLPTGAVVPFSHFFGADPSVMTALRDVVRHETTPLTDVELAAALLQREIAITPQTVARYRDQAGIPPATMRRPRVARMPVRAAHVQLRPVLPRLHFNTPPVAPPVVDYAAVLARSQELLHDMLDARERKQLADLGYLDVASPGHPERFYRIPERHGRVRMYEQGNALCELCVVSIEALPPADVIVMHKLLIQGDEEAYLLSANRFPVPTAPVVRHPLVERTFGQILNDIQGFCP